MEWAKRLRFSAGALALALAAPACVSSNVPVVGPTTPGTEGGRPTSVAPPGPGGTGPARTGGGPTRPGGTVTGTLPQRATFDDDGAVGAMARAYLRRSPAASLVVEVDWVAGRAPSQSALDHLGSVLRRELDKPAGIRIVRGNQIASGRSSWTIGDLRALERANRSDHSGGSRATLWLVYVDGAFAENANALALAYTASSSAIFRERIDDATTALIIASEIERSVVLHEAGHMLALVNIGYQSRFDHEDAAHPNHSNDPNSVMYWAVEDVSVRNLLRGGPPDDFTDADRADLAMLRAG